MTEQNRAPQPYDDGPRFDDETTATPDLAAPADEAAQEPILGDAVTEGVQDAAPAENFAAPADSFDGAPAVQDERLLEAIQRSRDIPLDGNYDEFAAAAPAAEPAEAASNESRGEAAAAQAAPTAAYGTEQFAQAEASAPQAAPEPQAATAPQQAPVPQPANQTIEVDTTRPADDLAPLGISVTEGLLMRPEKGSNRGFAMLMSIFATVLFAAGYAGAFTLTRKLFAPELDFMGALLELVGSLQFYLPVLVFFLVFLVWSLLANRARWWGYIVASQVIAVLVAAACYAAVALGQAFGDTPLSVDLFVNALRDYAQLPGALLAALVAMPVVTWLGGISAMRGRRLMRRYDKELAEYEQRVATERAEGQERRGA